MRSAMWRRDAPHAVADVEAERAAAWVTPPGGGRRSPLRHLGEAVHDGLRFGRMLLCKGASGDPGRRRALPPAPAHHRDRLRPHEVPARHHQIPAAGWRPVAPSGSSSPPATTSSSSTPPSPAEPGTAGRHRSAPRRTRTRTRTTSKARRSGLCATAPMRGFSFSAPKRTRTSTGHSSHKALNLARLPIPPPARDSAAEHSGRVLRATPP
jgi:hypothetical protein